MCFAILYSYFIHTPRNALNIDPNISTAAVCISSSLKLQAPCLSSMQSQPVQQIASLVPTYLHWGPFDDKLLAPWYSITFTN